MSKQRIEFKALLAAAGIVLASLAATAACPGAACARASAEPPAPERIIEIKNHMFMPVTVEQGTKVTWINRDQVPHTVTENNRLFQSAVLAPGDTFSTVFDKPGTYDYHCAIHPYMVSRVVVTAVQK